MYIYNKNKELVQYEPDQEKADLLLFHLDTEEDPHFASEEKLK